MKESQIEKKVTEYAKGLKWISYKFVSPQNRGVPDRFYVKGGLIFFIEFKAKTGTLSALQKHTINIMRDHGAHVHVVYSVDEGKDLIDRYEKLLKGVE